MVTTKELDADRIERELKKLVKGNMEGAVAYNLIDELLELRVAKGRERAAALYRLTLEGSDRRRSKDGDPGERFVDPPPEIVTLVASDVYPYLRPFLEELSQRNNYYSVGTGLTTLVTGVDAKGVPALARALTEGIRGYTDSEVASFILALTQIDSYDASTTARRKAILEAGLPAALAGRDIPLAPRARAFLQRLGVAEGSAPRLPKALPATIDDALALLRRVGVKLVKPSAAKSTGVPPELRTLYSATGAVAPYVAKATRLPALSRALTRALARADSAEGIAPGALSEAGSLVAFGESSAGDIFFVDPKRHGSLVFRFIHDEELVAVEATSLGAFVAYGGLEDWAADSGLEDRLDALRDADRRAAARALRAAGPRRSAKPKKTT